MTSLSFLDDAPATRSNIDCTGVKMCEYIDPQIRAMHHKEVTQEMLEQIKAVRIRNGVEDRGSEVNRLVTCL
jgi:hypothetical protein